MNKERMKSILKAYMVFIGTFGQFLYFAQAYQIYSTKSVSDLSLMGFLAGLVSVTSWLIYGIVLKDLPLIIANVTAVIGALLVVMGILVYQL